MRRLILVLLVVVAPVMAAESIRVCYNYGCVVEAEVVYSDQQLAQVRDLLGVARNPAEERERLSLAIGWLLGWAGEQTPVSADRGGNYADAGVAGRMDCIDHSTTTTRLLRLLEGRSWLQFHRAIDVVRRVRYLFEVHYSAQIEEVDLVTSDSGADTEPARYVVDSWFRDNGRPALVMALANWRDGEGREESVDVAVVAAGPGEP